MTSDPDFKVTTLFEVEYRKKRRVLMTKLLLYDRKLHLIYGMVGPTVFGDLNWPINASRRFVSIFHYTEGASMLANSSCSFLYLFQCFFIPFSIRCPNRTAVVQV